MPLYMIAALTTTALVSPAFSASPEDVAQTYVDLAAAGNGDSLITAQALQKWRWTR